jgi:hypothetical protein
MGKNQDPGSGINIPDPQHWLRAQFVAPKYCSQHEVVMRLKQCFVSTLVSVQIQILLFTLVLRLKQTLKVNEAAS